MDNLTAPPPGYKSPIVPENTTKNSFCLSGYSGHSYAGLRVWFRDEDYGEMSPISRLEGGSEG